MKIVSILFAIGILCPLTTTALTDQENVEAIQIVKPTGNYSFEYVKDNKLEKILNSEEIRDRYVVVISIVGRIQTGKSLMLNIFLNYLRKTYNIWSPFSNRTYEAEHWMDMNVKNGFSSKHNSNGTTKGIWAWPEIFTHDNISNGNKVAIILLDTEGLFHSGSNLNYNTKIFALSTLFSSMQGYNVHRGVYSDTLELLDVFTSYTVYGSRIVNSLHSSNESPFQKFFFIVRDTPSQSMNDSEDVTLNKIFPADGPDQNREMKARFKSVFRQIRLFQLPFPGENVTSDSFDGHPSAFNQNFKTKTEAIVTEDVSPANIVIKEIYGERVKARDLSRLLKDFTDVVENNITAPTSLVEVLANASNWMLHEKFGKLYNDSMFRVLDARSHTLKPYFEKDELATIHFQNKNDSIVQFRNLIKYGGDALATPFEDLLSGKIDEYFENVKLRNEVMRHEFLNKPKVEAAEASLLICVAALGCVALIVGVYKVSKNRENVFKCCRNQSPKKVSQDDNVDFEEIKLKL